MSSPPAITQREAIECDFFARVDGPEKSVPLGVRIPYSIQGVNTEAGDTGKSVRAAA